MGRSQRHISQPQVHSAQDRQVVPAVQFTAHHAVRRLLPPSRCRGAWNELGCDGEEHGLVHQPESSVQQLLRRVHREAHVRAVPRETVLFGSIVQHVEVGATGAAHGRVRHGPCMPPNVDVVRKLRVRRHDPAIGGSPPDPDGNGGPKVLSVHGGGEQLYGRGRQRRLHERLRGTRAVR